MSLCKKNLLYLHNIVNAFVVCRWEPYDPTKSYEKYTIADAKLNFNQKAPVPVPPKVGYTTSLSYLNVIQKFWCSVANPSPGKRKTSQIIKRKIKRIFMFSCSLSLEGWKPPVEILYGAYIETKSYFLQIIPTFCYLNPGRGTDSDLLLRLDPDPHSINLDSKRCECKF